MDRESVLAILRHHAPELRAAGLLHLRLFGSVARGQATTLSDVDLLAEFDRSKQMTLVTLAGLESHLSELLGRRVELSSAEWMREPVRERALAEAVLAF
jgi:predicted nucleotidyltransferase